MFTAYFINTDLIFIVHCSIIYYTHAMPFECDRISQYRYKNVRETDPLGYIPNNTRKYCVKRFKQTLW